jgi:hypothetical protein
LDSLDILNRKKERKREDVDQKIEDKGRVIGFTRRGGSKLDVRISILEEERVEEMSIEKRFESLQLSE